MKQQTKFFYLPLLFLYITIDLFLPLKFILVITLEGRSTLIVYF